MVLSFLGHPVPELAEQMVINDFAQESNTVTLEGTLWQDLKIMKHMYCMCHFIQRSPEELLHSVGCFI